MTLQALYQWGKQILTEAELESPAFDAVCLFSAVFGMDRHALLLHGGLQATAEREAQYRRLIFRRADREPLQYILGEWPFMDMSFSVGQGVLIPREDTRILVEEGIRLAGALGRRPVVYDLCAGSGAVAAGIARSVPNAEIYCFELSDAALPYLKRNLSRYAPDTKIIRLDVLSSLPGGDIPKPDMILSNPPYIPTGELESLQPEVKREPALALDGGAEGLIFYETIARKWSALLPPDGGIAVEIGAGQADAVCGLFSEHGLRIRRVLKDMNSLERVVSAGWTEN